jgi:hypothetical protein
VTHKGFFTFGIREIFFIFKKEGIRPELSVPIIA